MYFSLQILYFYPITWLLLYSSFCCLFVTALLTKMYIIIHPFYIYIKETDTKICSYMGIQYKIHKLHLYLFPQTILLPEHLSY